MSNLLKLRTQIASADFNDFSGAFDLGELDMRVVGVVHEIESEETSRLKEFG